MTVCELCKELCNGLGPYCDECENDIEEQSAGIDHEDDFYRDDQPSPSSQSYGCLTSGSSVKFATSQAQEMEMIGVDRHYEALKRITSVCDEQIKDLEHEREELKVNVKIRDNENVYLVRKISGIEKDRDHYKGQLEAYQIENQGMLDLITDLKQRLKVAEESEAKWMQSRLDSHNETVKWKVSAETLKTDNSKLVAALEEISDILTMIITSGTRKNTISQI